MTLEIMPEAAPTSQVYLPVYPVAPKTMHSYCRFVCAIASKVVCRTSTDKLEIATFAISSSVDGRLNTNGRLSLRSLMRSHAVAPEASSAGGHAEAAA